MMMVVSIDSLHKVVYFADVQYFYQFVIGLTMLLPYILSLRSNYQNCKLRVFALSHGKDEEMEEKK